MFDCAVVIPAYNAARFIVETVASVASAGLASVQIIIVNDGSTDDTGAIILDLSKSYSNITVVFQENSGVSIARNVGLQLVSAPYVCFLDADDRLRAGSLACMAKLLGEHPNAVAAYGTVSYIDENSEIRDYSSSFANRDESFLTLNDVLQKNFVDNPGAILFRSSALVLSGGFDPLIKIGEDWELYVRLARLGSFVNCNKVVVDYRIHNQSAMRKHNLTMRDYEPALIKVFDTMSESYNLSHFELKAFEFRRRASLHRLNIILSFGIMQQVTYLMSLLRLVVISNFDKKVLFIASRSFISALKRI